MAPKTRYVKSDKVIRDIRASKLSKSALAAKHNLDEKAVQRIRNFRTHVQSHCRTRAVQQKIINFVKFRQIGSVQELLDSEAAMKKLQDQTGLSKQNLTLQLTKGSLRYRSIWENDWAT